MRGLQQSLDALFVEGPDDGAVVNALVAAGLRVDLATPPRRIVRVRPEGGGDRWALGAFDAYLATARPEARVGVIVDRDTVDNDKWPAVRERLKRLGLDATAPDPSGAIVRGRIGLWMWPDNVRHGRLEQIVTELVGDSPALAFARDASRRAREEHGAEFDPTHIDKATLKVRSVWRDATAAGGYGHLIRGRAAPPTPGVAAFLAWFQRLFLTP